MQNDIICSYCNKIIVNDNYKLEIGGGFIHKHCSEEAKKEGDYMLEEDKKESNAMVMGSLRYD